MGNPAYIDAKPDPRPGSRGYFVWYWTVSAEGRSKWVTSPHPWTALRRHLRGKVPAAYLDRTVSLWFHHVFGYWSGDRKGSNPVGPG